MNSFRLVSSHWASEFDNASCLDSDSISIVCPFIKAKSLEQHFKKPARPMRVITRFNLDDFNSGVSDVKALSELLKRGAVVRGVKGLHAKLYIFERACAIATSANLTEAAMLRNHEFGFVATDEKIVSDCQTYFDSLWEQAGANLTAQRIDDWQKQLDEAKCLKKAMPSLGDEGTVVNVSPLLSPSELPSDAAQAFVKFFGSSTNRAELEKKVIDELREGSSHWVCTYKKRPRQVRDGAIMFLSRMVTPNDYRIYGRAIGRAYQEGIDDASEADISKLHWHKEYNRYIRVSDPKCINGKLEDGISLAQMMDALGPDSFESTQRNLKLNGGGNTDPRSALKQKPHVRLTSVAKACLSERLEAAFLLKGTITASDERLTDTWPESN